MKARENFRKAPSTDFLVCFPPRAHLTLMPKPICSPARTAEPNKRRHRLKKSASRVGRGVIGGSPLLWAKNKQIAGGGSEIAEPTSPKVTCAGQIKVRHKGPAACKSWQSVMEEIERIHNRRKNRKRPPSWMSSIGFKKEVMQFLTCLRNIRFDFRCFGSIPQSDLTSSDDDDGDEDEEEEGGEINRGGGDDDGTNSRAVFSKWFTVLQENQNDGKEISNSESDLEARTNSAPPPPPNALLLMRCRSAPAKSWIEEREGNGAEKEEKKGGKNLKALMEEEEEIESIVMMKYGGDLYKISSEIAKETWIDGGGRAITDPLSLSRSRSSKR